MEEELNTKNTEIVEDMPDFEEITAEIPAENAESVDNQSADAENEIVSEENADDSAETEAKTEEKQEDASGSNEKKDEEIKNNLPAGFSFNPLQLAIRPLYEKAIAEDELFAKEVKEKESRKENPKSLSECADYLMGEAYHYASQNRNGNFGLAGMPDDEMENLIKHYYDEDDIVIRKVGAGTRAKVVATKTDKAKDKAKAKEKPKPKANVIDITKAITAKPKAEDGKKPKREKKKDNLLAGFVPMERPDAENYEKEAKKGSREQAKSVEQLDMFADFFAE